MQTRRSFLKKISIGGGLLLAGQFPFEALAKTKTRQIKITILHTNDTHSRIEPFPATDKEFPNMGGVARRASMIKKIRKEEKHVLLFDAGDFFQGTTYFNLYKGETEIKAMNMMEYDACTLGNHEFDLGLDNLAFQLKKANFPTLCANYNFDRTVMKGITEPYRIFNKDGIKIGVFGLGVNLYGLVASEAYGKTWHTDGIKVGKEVSKMLKEKKGCDIVICLSHLGFEYTNVEKPSDRRLAKESEHIDLIIGGHTHTFLEDLVVEKNLRGRSVVINQMGWGGVKLGRIDYIFKDKKTFFAPKANTVIIGK